MSCGPSFLADRLNDPKKALIAFFSLSKSDLDSNRGVFVFKYLKLVCRIFKVPSGN